MSSTGQPLNFDETDPAAPSGAVNVVFQADAPTQPPTNVVRNISAYVPAPTTSAPGCVPPLPNVATEYLDGTGNWSTPAGGGGGSVSSLFSKNYFSSSTRAFSTVYQNTSSQPIIVMGEVSSPTLTAYVGPTSSPTTAVNIQSNSGGSGFSVCFCFLVPPSYYYEIVASSFQVWAEFEILSGSVTFSGELSGSRSLSTVYQNTSGKAMLICAVISGIGGSVALTGISDSSSSPTTVVWLSSESGSNEQTVWMMIPNNHYYEITCSGGAVAHWNEYSLPFNATKSSSDLASIPQNRFFGTTADLMQSWLATSGGDIWTCASLALTANGNGWLGAQASIPPYPLTSKSTQGGHTIALPALSRVEEWYGIMYNTGSPTVTHWWDYALA